MFKSLLCGRSGKLKNTAEHAVDRPFDENVFMRARLGVDVASVVQSEINAGEGSLSLVQFALPSGPFMVRKTIALDRTVEISLMAELAKENASSDGAADRRWPFPEVYHVETGPESCDVYMRFVEGIAYRSRHDALAVAEPLSKAIHGLADHLPALCQAAGVTPADRGAPGEAFFATAEQMVGDRVEQLKEIARFQRDLPHSVCHNDIYWPNMGITFPGGEAEVVFIDFGMVGRNVVGAELHHFARLADRSESDAELFRRLVACISDHFRTAPSIVEINAFFYAGMRLMAFEKDTVAAGGSERVRELLKKATRLYETLDHN